MVHHKSIFTQDMTNHTIISLTTVQTALLLVYQCQFQFIFESVKQKNIKIFLNERPRTKILSKLILWSTLTILLPESLYFCLMDMN